MNDIKNRIVKYAKVLRVVAIVAKVLVIVMIVATYVPTKAEKELDVLKRELSHMEERMKSLAADISIALSALERGV